jgi:inosose dehydratase
MPHLLSCFTNTYGRFGPQAAFRLLPRAGIEHVELPIKNAGVPSFFKETPLLTDASTEADVDQVRIMLQEAGLRLSSCNITSGNVLQSEVVARTLVKLKLARALGVSLVVGGAGEAADEDSRKLLWDHLRHIGAAAAEVGIIYCCETHPGACQNAERMLETMCAVDHPNVRINFDTGNLYYYNRGADLERSLRRVAPLVAHVHLKDTPGGYEQWDFAEIGRGIVDFALVRGILDAEGYTGPFSLELEGTQGEPDPDLEDYQARVVRSVAHLRKCGY